jgi:hypothetical protein
MADIESNIRTFLLQDANVLSAFAARIYIDKVADGAAYPFAKLSTVTDSPSYTQDGEYGRQTIFQVDVYDDDKAGCNTNAGYIRAALSGYTGLLSDKTVGMCKITNEFGEWSPDARHFRRMMQVEVKWTV